MMSRRLDCSNIQQVLLEEEMKNRQSSREEENEIDNSSQYPITKHISFRANTGSCVCIHLVRVQMKCFIISPCRIFKSPAPDKSYYFGMQST